MEEDTKGLADDEVGARRRRDFSERIVDWMNDSLLVLSPSGTIERVNAATMRLLGYEEHELLGQSIHMVLGETATEESTEEQSLLERITLEASLGQCEMVYRTKRGENVPVQFSGSAIYGMDFEVEALVCVARDITQRKAAEEYAQTVLDAAPVGFLIADSEGRIEHMNRAAGTLFGYTEQELIGEQIDRLVPSARRQTLRPLAEDPARAVPVDRDVEGHRKDGTAFVAHLSLTPTTLQGRAVVLAGVFDRTEFHEAEKALRLMEREASRMAGMSEVATGVLHRVGNVVNSVSVSAGVVRGKVRKSSLHLLDRIVGMLEEHGEDRASLSTFLTEDPRGERIVESLSVIAQRLMREQAEVASELECLDAHVGQIAAIVSSQQEYARPVSVLEDVELGTFLDKALALSGTALNDGQIQIERHYMAGAVVRVDSHRMMQIMLNLLSNARHALEDTDADPRRIELRTEACDSDTVAILLSDNGSGISEQNIARIFEHGFTTKSTGHGFGLHISAIAAIEMGAELTAHSEGPGKGATFRLSVPARRTSLRPDAM